MKRVRLFLLALLLPSAAFAQTGINVSFTYTSGAAAAATAASTTVPAKVTSIVNSVINPSYTANGIDAQYSPYFDVRGAMGDRAPVDSAPLANVYTWAKYNVQPWEVRTSLDASISVHVTSTPGATSYYGSSTAGTGGPSESVIVIPYALLDTQLELALSRVLNSTAGYSARVRSFLADAPLNGQNYCYHTREAAPTDPNQVVPIPASYETYYGTGFLSQTQSATKANSCQAFRAYWISLNGGGSTTYASAAVVSGPSGDFCYLYDNNGHQTFGGANAQIIAQSASAGGTITCPEQSLGSYAKNANMAASPFLPLGSPSLDSVAAMNARKSTVYGWQFQNGQITAGKKTSLQWLGCYLLSPQCN